MTLEELRATTIYKKNAVLYDTVIDTYKAISGDKEGFKIYFYKQEQLDYSSHEEFKFYTHKLERINNSIEEFKSLSIDKKLSKGIKNLTDKTEALFRNKELKAYDLKAYRRKVSQIQNSMCNTKILDIINGLKIEINDLNINLPKTPTPVVTHKFYVSKKSNKPVDQILTVDLPVELKRAPIMNGYVLPLEVYKKQCVVWTGHKPAPLMGSGFQELWEQRDNKWQCIDSSGTWVS
ncbi:hypothetical protein N9M71_02415 [Winogradskyella sp.]|nr:hypothetical protein [Winogradskyella sp.]MDG1659814.1 hypothetical protein [Winogradskyella sp.]